MNAAAARLLSVLERENAVLAALDLGAVETLADEKARALADLADLSNGARFGASAGKDLVRALVAAAAENKRLLEWALAVQGRVIALVARAAVPDVAAEAYGRGPGRRGGPVAGQYAVAHRPGAARPGAARPVAARPVARLICGQA